VRGLEHLDEREGALRERHQPGVFAGSLLGRGGRNATAFFAPLSSARSAARSSSIALRSAAIAAGICSTVTMPVAPGSLPTILRIHSATGLVMMTEPVARDLNS